MKDNFDLNKYKQAWEKGTKDLTEKENLDESRIKSFLEGNSKDLSGLYKKGLYFDIFMKSILALALAVLVIFLSNVESVNIPAYVVIAATLVMSFYQSKNVIRFPDFELGDKDLRTVIKDKMEYYKDTYFISLVVGAATSPIFFLTGMLYYFFFKYGEVREFDPDDYVVFGAAILISFLISFFSQVWTFRFHMDQLKRSLTELTEENINQMNKDYELRKKTRKIIAGILIIVGLVLLISYTIIVFT